jgi:hypothetical protein
LQKRAVVASSSWSRTCRKQLHTAQNQLR